MNIKILGVVLLILGGVFVGLIIFLLRGRVGENVTQKVSAPTVQVGEGSASEPTSDVEVTLESVKVEVSATEFAFSPFEIRGKLGQEIEIIFKNDGKMAHDLVFEDGGYKTKLLQQGQTETLRVKFGKEGFYTFYCSVAGHRQAGMEGVLIIE